MVSRYYVTNKFSNGIQKEMNSTGGKQKNPLNENRFLAIQDNLVKTRNKLKHYKKWTVEGIQDTNLHDIIESFTETSYIIEELEVEDFSKLTPFDSKKSILRLQSLKRLQDEIIKMIEGIEYEKSDGCDYQIGNAGDEIHQEDLKDKNHQQQQEKEGIGLLGNETIDAHNNALLVINEGKREVKIALTENDEDLSKIVLRKYKDIAVPASLRNEKRELLMLLHKLYNQVVLNKKKNSGNNII
jgi:hypothetical protein